MSYLRLDDTTRSHPKLLELTRADRWRWLDLLLQVAQRNYRTGIATPGMIRAADINRALAAELVDLHLLDVAPDGTITVHDWQSYNPPKDPTGRQRQARLRARQAAEQAGETVPTWAAKRAENISRLGRKHDSRPEDSPQHSSGLDPSRNASRNASRNGDVTSPTPKYLKELPPPTPPQPPSDDPPRTSGRVGNLEPLDPAAELERLRALAGDAPSWPPDNPDKGDQDA